MTKSVPELTYEARDLNDIADRFEHNGDKEVYLAIKETMHKEKAIDHNARAQVWREAAKILRATRIIPQ